MKTLDELKAEQAAALAKLELEHAIASLCPVPPHSVMKTATGDTAWISYKAPSLWAALDILAQFKPIAIHKFKGTYTRLEPAAINARRTRDKGEDKGGPYVAIIETNGGDRFGPYASFDFFAFVGADICKIKVSIESGYIGQAPAYGARFVKHTGGRSRVMGDRAFIYGSFNPNPTLSGMSQGYVSWGGSDDSWRMTYLIGADDESDDGAAEWDIDAVYRLENIANAMHGEKPETEA